MEQKIQVIWSTRCKVLARYISIYVDVFQQKQVSSKVHQKQKLFREGFALDYVWPLLGMVGNAVTPPKNVSENVLFLGLRLFLGHFGQQTPESPMSQLQKGVSTSSLPPFIVDVLIFKVYPRFFRGYLKVFKGIF